MAESGRILQTLLKVDMHQSSRDVPKALDNLAAAGNNAMTKQYAKGSADRQKIMEQNIQKSTQASKQNDQELIKNTEKVAKRAASAANEAIPKRPPPPKPGKPDTAPLKAHRAEYVRSMEAMGKAYKKFTQDAAKMGLKVPKSARGWGGREAGKFAKKGAEDRGDQINRVRTLVSEQKRYLKTLDKETEEYEEQRLVLQHLERQQLDMMNIDRDKNRAEKKHAKIKKKIDDDLKAAAKEKKKTDKAENRRLKINIQTLKEVTAAVRGYAEGIKSGLKNAFLIGTAAAAAFFYKMQPVVEQVMEFEKELMNAQSIFQVHRSELHELSDVVTEFGLQYGIAYDTAVKGLYQYASAGVAASEANEMLAHTLKLSMAVQGDHEALAKLTTQTIMGFSMEFSQAEEVTDKFAHAINKSLIEWDDLASSVKFALPFFISTGQSIDQLLGALQVLTNRALEAGIAGRGLRQALAEFTQHAEDNAAAFNKMGVEILDMAGNMKPLNEIAQQFKDLMGDNINDMDIMMALMEDLNIRGATAFVHLVQNAEEFTAAVGDLQNAAGTATEMAEIQQQSLSMQIQRVKNALIAPFLFSDKIGEANNTLNEFTLVIKELVDEFVQFFIIEDEMGNRLTKHGEDIKTFVVEAIGIAVEMIRELKNVFLESDTGLKTFVYLLHLAVIPLKLVLKVISLLGPGALKWIVYLKVLNKLIPLNSLAMLYNSFVAKETLLATAAVSAGKTYEARTVWGATTAWIANNAATLGWVGAIVLVIGAIKMLNGPMLTLVGVLALASAAWMIYWGTMSIGTAIPIILAGVAMGLAGMYKMMKEGQARATANVNWGQGGAGGLSGGTMAVGATTSFGGTTDLAGGVTPPAGMVAGGTSGTHIEIHGDVYDKEGFKEVLRETYQDMDDLGELDREPVATVRGWE